MSLGEMCGAGLSSCSKILYHAGCTEYTIKWMNEEEQLEFRANKDQDNKRENTEPVFA